MEKIWRAAGLEKERRTQVFCFRNVRLELPIGNSSGNVYQAMDT